jgi:hypothetical protein
LRSHRELLSPRGGFSFFQRLRSGDVRVGAAFALKGGVRRDRPSCTRGQPLAKDERGGDPMLAWLTPGRAAAAVLEFSSFLPQCDLEVITPTADDGRNALLRADEISDPRLARVTRPLPQRLSLCAAQEPIHYLHRDHSCLAPSGSRRLFAQLFRPMRQPFYARGARDGFAQVWLGEDGRSPDWKSAGRR